MNRKNIVILGATGSIGQNTLKVIDKHRDSFSIKGIACQRNAGELNRIANKYGVPNVVLYDQETHNQAVRKKIFEGRRLLPAGMDGLLELVSGEEIDVVVVAVVGTRGLLPTLEAIRRQKTIALASKEVLVLAGKFVMAEARRYGVDILPVDSEHNAIFQCLQNTPHNQIKRLILTASGGSFRDLPRDALKAITPTEALNHPNWDMGPKITIDSATMANKGLEMIEAHWLFDVDPGQIDVVIHRQSLVHSFVEFIDGSMLAQLCPPSMTFAIQHALFHPERYTGVLPGIDFSNLLKMDFSPPREDRYPCLRLARESLQNGGICPAVFNAANEVAVQAFLNNNISFLRIPEIIELTLEKVRNFEPETLEDVLNCDRQAREFAKAVIPGRS